MTEIKTHPALNKKIIGILRFGGRRTELYAAARIEELEAEVEQLHRNILLTRTETILAAEQTRLNDEVKRLNTMRLQQQREIERLKGNKEVSDV